MRRYSLFFISLCAPAIVSAAEPPALSTAAATVDVSSSAFQTVCDDLRAVTLVQADFTEEKTLHILSHPLESKGTLLFSPQQGVFRVMQEPVHQELLITRAQLTQKDAQGNIQHMGVRGQPAAQAFVDVFLSFFSGDRRGWEKTFETVFSGSERAWTIALIPRRKSPAKKVLRKILLEGHEGVLDTMTLTEANGDETHTQYSRQQVFHDQTYESSFHFPKDLKNP